MTSRPVDIEEGDQLHAFMLEIGRALSLSGTAVSETQERLTRIAAANGEPDARVVVLPTALMIGFGRAGWATLESIPQVAILLVAGAINALMYVLSLYFQDSAVFGMSALQAGLATLPAAAALIGITPLITPLAVRIGPARAIALGFAVSAVAFAVLALVHASWNYAAFVVPLIAIAAGLGLANGPASSVSTAAVSTDQVGQASGISNMARYVGGSVAVAAVAAVYSVVTSNHRAAGASAADALAAGMSRSALLLAIMSAAGVLLALLIRRHRLAKLRAVDRATVAAAFVHTIPITQPESSAGLERRMLEGSSDVG